MEGQAPAAPHGPTAGRSADASATGRGCAAWTCNGCNGGGREASPSRHPPPLDCERGGIAALRSCACLVVQI